MIGNCTKALAVSTLLLVSGCTLIPGSHMEGVGYSEQTNQLEQDLAKVNIQIIDSKLLAEQKSAQLAKPAHSQEHLDLTNYEYRLGVGDVLTIGVWDHPELTIPAAVQRTAEFDGFRVQPDGTITYAYAPNIQAAGKTVQEVHAELVKRLSKVIENPQVDIKIVGFRSQRAYVTGAVKKPGVYPISEIPLTLIDAINQAGGLTDNADWREVTFTRGEQTQTIKLNEFYANGDLTQNRLLQHGDVIHVNRSDMQKVFVLGDVVKAGTAEVNRYGTSLAEAITAVGGLNETTADANGVFVIRKRDLEKDGVIADVYQLHAKNAVALVLANQFQLEAQDIVYVTSAPIARWNRLISQLLPTITAIDSISEIENRGNVF